MKKEQFLSYIKEKGRKKRAYTPKSKAKKIKGRRCRLQIGKSFGFYKEKAGRQ